MRIETPQWIIKYLENLHRGNNIMCPDTPEELYLDLRDEIKDLDQKMNLIIKYLKIEFEEVPAQERHLEIKKSNE